MREECKDPATRLWVFSSKLGSKVIFFSMVSKTKKAATRIERPRARHQVHMCENLCTHL